ncbi:MAG TPA: flagellar FliJ family protein [Acidimicrobiia bacterium]|nr:flagellar FliJ family protein [Acidimicrobiia bacterium]
MKRFRFRLDQVLHVRRVQEDRARFDLLTANRDAHLAAARVDERLADYGARSMPIGPQAFAEFERAVFMLDSGAAAVGVARASHRDALAVVDVRRTEWTDARRRVAALERLEERRRAEHAIEMQRAEDQLVDDLVVARYARGDRA